MDQTLISSLENFFNATRTMENTVMIPTILQDLTLNQSQQETQQSELVHGMDPSTLFQTLKTLQQDLVSARISVVPQSALSSSSPPPTPPTPPTTPTADEDINSSSKLVTNFRFHVKELTKMLMQLSNSANAITKEYQQFLNDS